MFNDHIYVIRFFSIFILRRTAFISYLLAFPNFRVNKRYAPADNINIIKKNNQSGDVTHHQDQLIMRHNLSVINMQFMINNIM